MNQKINLHDLFGPKLITAAHSPGAAPREPQPASAYSFSVGGDDSGKRTVTAQRRRRGESTGERAQTPQRRRERPSGAGTPPPSGTPPRPPSYTTGGMLPGGGRNPLLTIGILILLAICVVPLLVIFGGGGDLGEVSYEAPPAVVETVEMVEQVMPTAPVSGFTPPAPSGEGGDWLVMLYQDADDKILEQDIHVDLNEAERSGSSERVQIVAQIDRYQAGFQGDGNWTSARRFYITRDNDLGRVNSQLVQDLGEVNMADGQTLVDFATWAIATFPADKYVLILSDHGLGWPGGWSDPAPGGRGDPDIPLASRLGEQLYLHELDDALAEIVAQTGIGQFELIGMDACLMGHIEVFSALAPYARYAVASQEVEPALGWAYTGFLDQLARYPDTDGAGLGQLIVDSYIQEDQRIVDDQARAEFLRQGSPMAGLFGSLGSYSADQLAQQLERDITLTAVDLGALPDLLAALNQLAYELQAADQAAVASARTYAQSYTSIFGNQIPPSYIDLGSFVYLLKRQQLPVQVDQAADQVLAALERTVIAEKHGPRKPGSTGISIYFPNSQLFSSPVTGPASYTAIARRFAQDSSWDEFLAYHYAGRTFDPAPAGVVALDQSQVSRAPGAGEIEISEIRLSDQTAAPGRPVTLSADISGENIGYIYLFVGFYDQASNSIFLADADYLESSDTRQSNGVYYPDWGKGEFTLEFAWEPVLFAISDGVDSVVARFKPQSYGASWEEALYSVDGIYTYADSGDTRYARLFFSDGLLRSVYGFTGEEGTGAPREIIPQTGDTFTVLEQWMDLDQSGRVTELATQEGGTLTFGAQMFEWKELAAAAGPYVVGFLVEDLDGNLVESYAQVVVE